MTFDNTLSLSFSMVAPAPRLNGQVVADCHSSPSRGRQPKSYLRKEPYVIGTPMAPPLNEGRAEPCHLRRGSDRSSRGKELISAAQRALTQCTAPTRCPL